MYLCAHPRANLFKLSSLIRYVDSSPRRGRGPKSNKVSPGEWGGNFLTWHIFLPGQFLSLPLSTPALYPFRLSLSLSRSPILASSGMGMCACREIGGRSSFFRAAPMWDTRSWVSWLLFYFRGGFGRGSWQIGDFVLVRHFSFGPFGSYGHASSW